ncbi:carbohydrate-binding module family 50 protein [Lepidopterella palustris CBS 459.81]|uniref:Carbohydrate-binding module family 50 protein n=1 Tax=Lepidopterella palustris CBS 459.81 TaxID=1314670 RepID=A0A8E2JB90_9PEZI|nr:carbohydrate-binding module family 50 protein [Lepidopterella palustris CBS 459.81]
MAVLHFLILSILYSLAVTDFVLFPYSNGDGSVGNPVDGENGFGNTTAISLQCAQALNQTIACDPRIQYLASAHAFTSINNTGSPTTICASTCRTSLESYHSNVSAACDGFHAFDGLPSSWRGDIIRDYFDVVCATDPQTGQYCTDVLLQQYAAFPGVAFLDLPTSVLCSSCQTTIWRASEASLFNGYDYTSAQTWKAIQQKCGTSYPTQVQPFPNITLPNETAGSPANQTCLSGKTYVVTPSDTCHSIALANSVAEGTLWAMNNLFADCSNMQSGQSLCLPNQCTTYAMSSNESCISIAIQNRVPYASLLSWNPTINSDCSNISPNGSVICISSPFATWNGTTITGASPTQTAAYAETTVPPPAATAFASTLNCGTWYIAQDGDTCARISLSDSISLALLYLINPSIDSDCSNLIPGLAYCVQPTYEWNATAIIPTDTTVVAPPGPTESGTTATCYVWHVVAVNETCGYLDASYGISFAQFKAWNPSIDENCFNLIVGEAYCMKGPPVPSTSSTPGVSVTTASPTSAAGISTSSTSSAEPSVTSGPVSCSKTYTVASGDYCYKIWTDNGLTEAQFRALNPSLDAGCDLIAGQVVCVAA